jgi:enoyl-CoA hydratase/carnithine racemase
LEVSVPYWQRIDEVAVMNLGVRGVEQSENTWHPAWMMEVHALLDEILDIEGPLALVTTSSGKCYSTGLDLTWVKSNPEQWDWHISEVDRLLARFLTLPLVTVAALPGHAFAAGAMLALAHDRRIMRADRGFYCFPEVDVQIPVTPGMSALIMSKLPAATAHEALVTGRRYGGEEAEAAGLVDATVTLDRLLPEAISHAADLARKRGSTLQSIKSSMYGHVITTLQRKGHSPS